jgi:hypothetical protein
MTDEEIQKMVVRGEKTAFLMGTTMGQLSNLLNNIVSTDIDKQNIYKELKDIWRAAALQIHEIYYKNNI